MTLQQLVSQTLIARFIACETGGGIGESLVGAPRQIKAECQSQQRQTSQRQDNYAVISLLLGF